MFCVYPLPQVQKGENISTGDTVRMCNNLQELKALQVGHGEWNKDMKEVSRMLRGGYSGGGGDFENRWRERGPSMMCKLFYLYKHTRHFPYL